MSIGGYSTEDIRNAPGPMECMKRFLLLIIYFFLFMYMICHLVGCTDSQSPEQVVIQQQKDTIAMTEDATYLKTVLIPKSFKLTAVFVRDVSTIYLHGTSLNGPITYCLRGGSTFTYTFRELTVEEIEIDQRKQNRDSSSTRPLGVDAIDSR